MCPTHAPSRETHYEHKPLPQQPEVGKKLIDDGRWAECWICYKIFGRQRKTNQYCHRCQRGFCNGEHGSWQGVQNGKGYPLCVVCQIRDR